MTQFILFNAVLFGLAVVLIALELRFRPFGYLFSDERRPLIGARLDFASPRSDPIKDAQADIQMGRIGMITMNIKSALNFLSAAISISSTLLIVVLMFVVHQESIPLQREFQYSAAYWLIAMLIMFVMGVITGKLRSKIVYSFFLPLWLVFPYFLNEAIDYDGMLYMFNPRPEDRPVQIDILIFIYMTLLSSLMWGVLSSGKTLGNVAKIFRKLSTAIKSFLKYEKETRGIK